MDIVDLANRAIRKIQNYHVGQENEISGQDLQQYLGLTNDRDLRTVVDYARRDLRKPILSTSNGGYSWPTGRDDDAYKHCVSQRREVGRQYYAGAEAIERAMEAEFGALPLFEYGEQRS
jgi:hypothetical protein